MDCTALDCSLIEVIANVCCMCCQNLSYAIVSGSEITPCNKIDKQLVVNRFSGNVMTSITTLHT